MTRPDISMEAVERIFDKNWPRSYNNLADAEKLARALSFRVTELEDAITRANSLLHEVEAGDASAYEVMDILDAVAPEDTPHD